jgi:hypothetical protein
MNTPNLITHFRKLTRHSKWQLTGQIALQFNNHHAQGMVRIGDLYYLSTVELLEAPVPIVQPGNASDRTPGKGNGYLIAFDLTGKQMHRLQLGEGDMYHPGGIDFDGRHLWVSIGEYRPHSRSIIYKVDPETMIAEEAFRVKDHIGGISRDGRDGTLIGYSWGSRKFYRWTPEGTQLAASDNSSHFVDYQDGQYIGDGKMVLSGITELPTPVVSGLSKSYELGGLALVDLDAWQAEHEIPVPVFSPHGRVITRNPVWLESTESGIRLYAVPDDDQGALLIFETS